MRLTLLYSGSNAGGCPTVYETDDGRLVVQGDLLADAQARADLKDVLAGESAVVVPRDLIVQAARRMAD